MLKLVCRVKREQWAGVLLVFALHGGLLFALVNYRTLPSPAPDKAVIVMVSFISPPLQAVKTEPPKPVKQQNSPRPVRVAQPGVRQPAVQLTSSTARPMGNEPLLHDPLPTPPARPAPAVDAPAPSPQIMAADLSVSCPERPAPDYPRMAMRLNQQGKGMLRVELNEDGSVAVVEIKTSSGYPLLDVAALKKVKTWRCKPAQRNGVAVRTVALQPFKFYMKDE